MKIRCIIIQRSCRYPGEYAPELWDAWSEYVLEDNHEGYQDKLDKAQALVGKEFDAVREMDLLVPEQAIDTLFAVPEVQATAKRVSGLNT